MHWIFLISAIVLEVLGVSVLNASDSLYAQALMLIAISFSYYLLAIAVRRIPISIAYATWEGVGIALVSVVAVFMFGEHLNLLKVLGLISATAGILMVNFGEENEMRHVSGDAVAKHD